MSTAPAPPPGQKLPQKFDAQFKQLVKMYESKQMKKALKTADTILKSHPDHGETLAMKGLVLSAMEKKMWGDTQPFQYAKLGLAKNLRSHVCWHVYGILYRQEHNYAEAIKSYRNALKIDPENQQILRDLATLQTHMRDISGLIETRNRLLELKPNVKINWIGMALAHHLAGNHEVAYLVLEAFEKATEATETSELQLYKAQVLIDGKDYASALKCLRNVEHKVLDKYVLSTLRGQCELELGEKNAASATYMELLKMNNNCPESLLGYARSKLSFPLTSFRVVLSPKQRAEVLSVLDELDTQLGGLSKNLRRQALDFVDGDELKRRLDAFARPYVLANIPSLTSALKSLYSSPSSVAVIEALFLEWKDELSRLGRFDGDDAPNPTCYLWVIMFLSVHCLRLNRLDEAKRYIEEAIEHSPTVEKLYNIRAKILKHEAKAVEAAADMNMARKLDLADRYLTNRCVKYMLRANQLEDAERIYATFSRAKEGEVIGNIVDLQCMWYEMELAESYYRQDDILSALQTFLLVDRHFGDFREDQFDFHGYCLRKYTLRAYVDMLRFHDDSKGYPVYLAAARRVVRCYLDIDHLGAEHVKSKVTAHAQKLNALAESPLGKVPALDNPLQAALPFLQALLTYAAKDITTHALAVEYYVRKGRHVLAAKSVLEGSRLACASSSTHSPGVEAFLKAASQLRSAKSQDANVNKIVDEVLAHEDVKKTLTAS